MSFKQELINGTAFTAISKYLSLFISLGVSAILSRILTPEDYGVIAIAMVIIGFITLLTGTGMGPAIIQNQTLTESNISSIFSFTTYLSVIAAVIFAACSPLIAHIYGDPQLLPLCLLLSINLLFSLLNIVPNALLFKEKRFKYIAIRTITVQVALGIISVIAAFCGAGIYALLINPILGSILLFLISYLCYKTPFRFRFEFEPVKRILPYSAYQIGFNIINYFYRNIDKLLIGKYMNLSQLGYYEKSYRLMMLPLENVSNVINPVLHPLLCEHQQEPSFIFNQYKKVTRYFAYFGFLISIYCFFCARDLMLIIFGQQWEESVGVFRIFSLSIGIQLVQSAVGAVFQSTGHVKQMFYAGICALFIMLTAIVGGLFSGSLDWLSVYVVIAFYVIFLVYHYTLISKVMHESLGNFLLTLVRPITASLILAGILLVAYLFFTTDSLILNLLIKTAVTIVGVILMQELKIIQDIPSLIALIKKPFSRNA